MYSRLSNSSTFFSSRFTDIRKFLPKNFVELPIKSNENDIQILSTLQNLKMKEMYLKYPHLLKYSFPDFPVHIAYTVTSTSPEEMIAIGGLKKEDDLWFSNTGSGNNKGCICFSLLPHIPPLFRRNWGNKVFLYAIALDKQEAFLTGSAWREIAFPGACIISNDAFFAAREILGIKENGQLDLGSMRGHKGKKHFIHGENFDKFCNNQLTLPKEINQGDDYPLAFDITDTPNSAKFQESVEKYYKMLLTNYKY